jgi:hypothetical protein
MKKIIALAATAAILLGAGQVIAANAKMLPTVAGPTVSPTDTPSGAPVGGHKHRGHGKHHFETGDIRTGDIRTGDIRGSFDFRSGDARPSFDVRGPHGPKRPHFALLSGDARLSFDVRPPHAPKFNASFDARPSQDARIPFGAPDKGHKPGHGGPRFQLPAPAPTESAPVTTAKFNQGQPTAGFGGFGGHGPKRRP